MPPALKKPKKNTTESKAPQQGSSKSATPTSQSDDELPSQLPAGEPFNEGKASEEDGSPKDKSAKAKTDKSKATAGSSKQSSKEISKKAGNAKKAAKLASKTTKKAPAATSHLSSGDSSDEKSTTSNADVFSANAHDSNDEATDELIKGAKRKAERTAETLRHLNAFLDTSKDKHFIEIPITPLYGKSNWETWNREVQLVMRMHQVLPLCEGELIPLEEDHEMSIWYERWVDIAIACIYKNVSPSVRENTCFVTFLRRRDPSQIMDHLFAHYGDHSGPHDVSDDDYFSDYDFDNGL